MDEKVTQTSETRNGTAGEKVHPVHGVCVRATAREAKRLSAILSPTRNFLPTGQRGLYVLPAPDEVLALRDADFLFSLGVEVVSMSSACPGPAAHLPGRSS